MIPSRLHRSLTVTSRRKPSSTMRILSSGVYLRRAADLTVRTKHLAACVRSSATIDLPASVWDISTPLSEVIYLIQGADPTSNLSGFSTPSGVPFSLTTYRYLYRPYRLARPTTAILSPSSSPATLARYLWVDRYCTSARQARRSEMPYSSRTRSTHLRRRAGLSSFPAPPPSGSACPHLRSATARLKRVCSDSISRNRLAWSILSPPYSCLHR